MVTLASSAKWFNPPRAKVYEALSAVADGRVHILETSRAEVGSSAGDKSYTVEWSADFKKFSSNDNASHWQGYLGYPIIAVLIALDQLQVSQSVLNHFARIPWKTVNKRHKNDYDKAVHAVLEELRDKGVQVDEVIREADRLYNEVTALGLEKLGRRRVPPSGK